MLDRFALHCAASPACDFGGDDPEAAIDALVERLDREPLPLSGHPDVIVDGDLVLLFLADLMYAPSLWPATAAMLTELEQGVTDIAGELFGVDLFGVDFNAFWAIMAADGDHPRGVAPYVDAIRHDPATPYRWGQRMARDLGAQLVTVHGEGHTSVRNPCVMQLAKRYLEDLELPASGVTCTQPNPFGGAAAARTAATGVRRMIGRERRLGAWGMPVPALVGR